MIHMTDGMLLKKSLHDSLTAAYKEYSAAENVADINIVDFLTEKLYSNGVIAPPIKAGDKVYINGILGGRCEEHIVTNMTCHSSQTHKEIWFNAKLVGYLGEANCSFGIDQIGKSVFRSREEAEKAQQNEET